MSLAPKPPPTSGAITRTWCGARSSRSATNWRIWCGTWEEAHTVSWPSAGVPVRHEPARLHRLAPAAPDAQRERGHARRRAQRGLDVAAGERHAPGHVVGDVVVDRGRARRERLGRRQRLVLDLEQLARVLRRVAAVRHHRGHRPRRRSARGRPRAGRSCGRAARRAAAPWAWRARRRRDRRRSPRPPRRGARGRARRPRGRMRAWACGLRRSTAWSMPGSAMSAHVAPAPGEQARVLLAEMPVADELHAERARRAPAAAASSAACTMCW